MSSNLTKKYPDTAAGAKQALADMSVFKLEDMVYAYPDPSVHGVWKVELPLSACIVYLAGYSEINPYNDFEQGDL